MGNNRLRAGTAPGTLKISDNGRSIVQDDGTPFFYWADTAWEMLHRLTREEMERYLQNRVAKGFNVIQTVALAELDGLHQPNRYGECPLIDDDPTKPNEAYWKHVDWAVGRANELGLTVALLPTWGDKWNQKWGVGPVVFHPENARAYGEWIARRYRDCGIIWILGGDRPIENEQHFKIIEAMALGVRAGDGGRHLVTFHPNGWKSSSLWLNDCDWLDVHMIQSGHNRGSQALQFLRHDWGLQPVRPFINGEPAYELIPNNFKKGLEGWLDEADVRRDLYYTICSGAAGYTYGAGPIWQFFDYWRAMGEHHPLASWQEALDLPGARQLSVAMNLLKTLPTTLREPADQYLNPQDAPILPAVACRDAGGTWALLYLPESQCIELNLEIVGKVPATAIYINPRNGEEVKRVKLEQGGKQRLVPPRVFDGGRDILLVIR